ncbi:hypothetical protein K435DRAFT_756748, partial [Dendrothele bispora CBS 962.96]
MADLVQFDVDDLSPTVLYSPIRDTLSTPNYSAGWNPLFNKTSLAGAPLDTGNSTSTHVTSLDGASLQIQWKGTAIRLAGSTISGASVNIQLDGEPHSSNTSTDSQTLYATNGLTDTNHTVTLTTNISEPQNNQSFVKFEKATIQATSSLPLSNQIFDDRSIELSGFWAPDSTNSSRVSSTLGDAANVTFLGASFIIRGVVSPGGANYSVTLDNDTTPTLSSRATLTKNDSVLFYASGLDPSAVHNLQMLNQGGGNLTLPFGGFTVFASGDPNPTSSSTSPTPSPAQALADNSGLPNGTVAALVLAGILAFLLLTGLLFYFFVYRPRRRRRQLRRHRTPRTSPVENGVVLNIGPGGHSPLSQSDKSPKTVKSKKSTGSGFRAWKEQARGANPKDLGTLGLFFRHSDSVKAKPGPSTVHDEWDYDDPSAKSFGFSLPTTVEPPPPLPQSQRSGLGLALGKGKGKGKKTSLWSLRSKKSSKSSSPSYNVDLPSLSKSKQSSSDNTNGRARYSYFSSEFTDITYMSTPTDHSHQLSFNDPPHQTHTSKRPSPSPNPHDRTDSQGLLLINQDTLEDDDEDGDSLESGPAPTFTIPSSHASEARPEVFVKEVSSSSYSESLNRRPEVYVKEVSSSSYSESFNRRPSVANSVPALSMRSVLTPSEDIVTRDVDRGSVRTYDDTLSVLGAATARAALRGLSPRTSEVPSLFRASPVESRPGAVLSQSPPSHPRHSLALSGESYHPRERLISDETVRPDASGRFLDVRTSSPFQIDFAGQRKDSRDRKKTARLSEGSRVRFDDQTAPPSVNEDKGKGKSTEGQLKLAAPPKGVFRLTPQMPLGGPSSPDATSSMQDMSFLDFSGSSSNSMISQSVDASGSSRRLSAFSGFKPGPRSRWSSTTGPSIAPGQHSSSSESHEGQPSERQPSEQSELQTSSGQSPPSSHFPYPVSLPASPHHPEGYKPSPPTLIAPELPVDNATSRSSSNGVHLHPSG